MRAFMIYYDPIFKQFLCRDTWQCELDHLDKYGRLSLYRSNAKSGTIIIKKSRILFLSSSVTKEDLVYITHYCNEHIHPFTSELLEIPGKMPEMFI